MKITVIILTFNEEVHIKRCIESIIRLVDEVVIVDSFSTDQTLQIAMKYKVKILQNKWINHSAQFNWALKQIGSADWILRVDADEILDISKQKLNFLINNISDNYQGILVNRSIRFQGKLLKFGGVYNVETLRFFRYGKGRSEDKWMDEHIEVRGRVFKSSLTLIDHNLNSITWWIDKHNKYASLEAIEMLNLKLNIFNRPNPNIKSLKKGPVVAFKRLVKEKVYFHLPFTLRAFMYFLYRYIFRLGFLDGLEGFSFHFLQGFWYRYLVDIKLREVSKYIHENSCSPATAIRKVFGVNIC